MLHDKKLREAIRQLIRELDTLKVPSVRGVGTAHPFIIKAPKQNLGFVQMPENQLKQSDRKPVKVSRAFNKEKPQKN